MRTLLLTLAPLLTLGCASDGGDDTDGGTDTDDGTADLYGDCHPLIGQYLIDQGKDPLNSDENGLCYQFITDSPCTRRNGSEGTRVYRMMDEGRVTEDGTFTATERWFWFHGDPSDISQDQVDLLTYEGTTSDISGEALNCVGCEEVFEVTRTVVENNTDTEYSTDVVFAFDNMNPNGGFQEDNKMFVFYARYTRRGLSNLDTSYARGFYFPDSGTPGERPASYTWGPYDIQGKCY